jgi:hypothetical protein
MKINELIEGQKQKLYRKITLSAFRVISLTLCHSLRLQLSLQTTGLEEKRRRNPQKSGRA